MSGPEQRRHPRVPVNLPVTVVLVDPLGRRQMVLGQALDLSQGGMRCRLEDAAGLAAGLEVSLHLRLPDGPLVSAGNLVRVDAGSDGLWDVGVLLAEHDEVDRRLAGLVASRSRPRERTTS
jgi:hypothetical protein